MILRTWNVHKILTLILNWQKFKKVRSFGLNIEL